MKRKVVSFIKKDVRTSKYQMRVIKPGKGKGSYVRTNKQY